MIRDGAIPKGWRSVAAYDAVGRVPATHAHPRGGSFRGSSLRTGALGWLASGGDDVDGARGRGIGKEFGEHVVQLLHASLHEFGSRVPQAGVVAAQFQDGRLRGELVNRLVDSNRRCLLVTTATQRTPGRKPASQARRMPSCRRSRERG